jgi:outer membrane protein insertion porin family
MKYDIPISEYGRLNVNFGYDNIKIFSTNGASQEIQDFVAEHGRKFDQFRSSIGWSRSTYDRAIFPTCGWKQYFGAEVGLPFTKHSLDYYKINYDTAIYYPIVKDWIIHFRGLLGYGNGYAEYDELPFFKNYYAGGIDSVRGYEDNTLGPRDSRFNPIGGNVLTVGSLSLIFPNPFPDQLRTSIFIDAGNVFHNDIGDNTGDRHNGGGIKTSTGVQFEWLSPMGLIHFSFSKALNPGKYDETRVFQFSLGASF